MKHLPTAIFILLFIGAAILSRIEWSGDLQFRDSSSLPGFRRLVLDGDGGITMPDPLVGLSAPDRPTVTSPVGNLCEALFGKPRDPDVGPADAAVTIVEFSDYQCPYCRVVAKFLPELQADNPSVRIVYKEWPVFGRTSELAARIALAADRQGAYAAAHAWLMKSRVVPTPALSDDLAAAEGLDAARLAADRSSPAIAAMLAANDRLARGLGFRGTPSFVVGRTLVEGAITRKQFQALIEAERQAVDANPCRS